MLPEIVQGQIAMRRTADIHSLMRHWRRALRGPHMLAFLPALCLAAYWGGGETVLMLCALGLPLLYALSGVLQPVAGDGATDMLPRPQVHDIAREFLAIARHNGQITACFQVSVPALRDLEHGSGAHVATEARELVRARIASVLRDADHVFDDGTDRFTILISPGFRLRLDTLVDLANRVRMAIGDPLSLDGMRHDLHACIGIASSLNFTRNTTEEKWLASALVAMQDAVACGSGSIRIWSEKRARRPGPHSSEQTKIADALQKGQVQAVFQPQVNIRTGAVSGMEAFARWDHPERGLIPAEAFLPMAAETGCMDALGRTILSQALAALRGWDSAGFHVPAISVNLSAEELRNPDLRDQIETGLSRTQLPAARLVFDISARLLDGTLEDVARHNLHAVAELGCAIDLDHFGTCRTTIDDMRRFPVRLVKIHGSLIRGADRSEPRKQGLGALIAMAQNLDMATLGAGVETLGEHGVLRDLGCGFAQGFLFAPATSAADVTLWLGRRAEAQTTDRTEGLRRVK